jgi:hypothetical protein
MGRLSRFAGRRVAAMLALLGLVALAAGSCGDDGGGSGSDAGPTTSAAPTTSSADPDRTAGSYRVVDTGQVEFYDDTASIEEPDETSPWFGQDAHHPGRAPRYTDNGDGTVTDEVTGLTWQQDPGGKAAYDDAVAGVETFALAGHDDWRLPTIKELYSLILFTGVDPSGAEGDHTSGLTPFLDTDVFAFEYGDVAAGERVIDAQFISATEDVGDATFGGGDLVFGVNFADGRIKGYPRGSPVPGGPAQQFFVRHVRGNLDYGVNDLVDHGDGTVTDRATGLMWTRDDSGEGLDWEGALAYAGNVEVGGHDDWRLPDAKELQSIVDYTRAPGASGSAAIDPVFSASEIVNEAGEPDFGFYWTGTTHVNESLEGANAAYVAFGRAMGFFADEWQDVHGAGAQRSDPKAGDPTAYPTGNGPQGDAVRIENLVRLVRDA